MKKLLLSLLALTLLAGCSGGFTANEKSYLDEKIKCKRLADVRVKEIKDNSKEEKEINSALESVSKYIQEEDTCLLRIKKSTANNAYYSIEDLLTGKTFDYDAKSFAILNCETNLISDECENILISKNKYDELVKKYFGEDAQ